jgi:hypothetical protein
LMEAVVSVEVPSLQAAVAEPDARPTIEIAVKIVASTLIVISFISEPDV